MLSLEKELNEAVKKHSAEHEREPGISLSQIGGCIRALILKDRGYHKKEGYIPLTEQQMRVFSLGYLFEGWVMNWFESRGIVVAKQIPCGYQGINGTADLIVKDDNKNILIDIKTVNSKKFSYMDKGEVDEHYAMQLTAYHSALQDAYNLSPIVRLFYIEKENALTREVAFKPESYKDILDQKIAEIKSYQKSGELPPELEPDEKGKQPWMCFSCSKQYGTRLWCQYIQFCPFVNSRYEQSKEGDKK